MRALASVALLTATVAIAGCGSKDDSAVGSSQASATSTPAVAASTAASTPAAAASDASAPKVKQGTCSKVSAPPLGARDVPKPTGKLDVTKTNLVTLTTSCGTIVVQLDPKTYPVTANAVAWLAKKGFYDKTIFHRVVPGFVIQGGDPTGTGSGGTSWKVVEAPKADATYPEGTFAMAKTGADASGTTQGQFFIMTGGSLDPSYAIAGKVISGMDAAHAIEALGAGQGSDGPPSQTVELIKASFSTK